MAINARREYKHPPKKDTLWRNERRWFSYYFVQFCDLANQVVGFEVLLDFGPEIVSGGLAEFFADFIDQIDDLLLIVIQKRLDLLVREFKDAFLKNTRLGSCRAHFCTNILLLTNLAEFNRFRLKRGFTDF